MFVVIKFIVEMEEMAQFVNCKDIIYGNICTSHIARASGVRSIFIIYTPTVIMLARYEHMNTQSPGGICYASLEVGWYSKYQPTSTKAEPYRPGSDFLKNSYIYPNAIMVSCI